MKQYETPEIELILFVQPDVITESIPGGGGNGEMPPVIIGG